MFLTSPYIDPYIDQAITRIDPCRECYDSVIPLNIAFGYNTSFGAVNDRRMYVEERIVSPFFL